MRSIRDVAHDDLKRLVVDRDAKAAKGESADGKSFGCKTAMNAWSVVLAMFRDAQRAKDPALCARDDNPAEEVAGPDVGAKKAKVYLWPSEFVKLVTCERVPVRWRRLFALAVYTYMRVGEIAALEWTDFDLEQGRIHIHRLDRPRAQAGHRFDEERPGAPHPDRAVMLPLLKALFEQVTGRHVFKMPSAGVLSTKLKR